MRRIALLLLFALAPLAASQDVRQSVLIVADRSQGTGVIFHNDRHTFVWTVAHVVEGVKTCEVVQGKTRVKAKVIRYDADLELALLVLDKRIGKSAKFATGTPRPGAAIWHIGCVHGEVAPNSVSDGVISAVNRKSQFTSDRQTYDQVAASFAHGCSGGGVYGKRSGECLGLVSQFVGDNPLTFGFGLIVPARQIRCFAKCESCEWAVDASIPVPEP